MEHWLERSFTTTDRQKKPLHHNLTGRECRGGTRGLAGLPQAAPEVLEGYLAARGLPWEMRGLNHKLHSPAYSTRARKGTQITFSCEKYRDFCLPGRNDWRRREPRKGPTHKIPFIATYPGLQQRGQNGLETCKESLGLVALGREMKEESLGSLCWVIPHTARAILLRQSTPLQVASGWGEARNPPTGIILPHPVVLKPDCWL